MGRKEKVADGGIAPVLEALAKAIKEKHIQMQTIGVKLGKSPTWLSGVLCRAKGMSLDDFLAVCRIAEIDPVLLFAAMEDGGMLRYIKDVPLVDIVNDAVRRHLEERIEGTDVMVRVPKKGRETNGHGEGQGGAIR